MKMKYLCSEIRHARPHSTVCWSSCPPDSFRYPDTFLCSLVFFVCQHPLSPTSPTINYQGVGVSVRLAQRDIVCANLPNRLIFSRARVTGKPKKQGFGSMCVEILDRPWSHSLFPWTAANNDCLSILMAIRELRGCRPACAGKADRHLQRLRWTVPLRRHHRSRLIGPWPVQVRWIRIFSPAQGGNPTSSDWSFTHSNLSALCPYVSRGHDSPSALPGVQPNGQSQGHHMLSKSISRRQSPRTTTYCNPTSPTIRAHQTLTSNLHQLLSVLIMSAVSLNIFWERTTSNIIPIPIESVNKPGLIRNKAAAINIARSMSFNCLIK